MSCKRWFSFLLLIFAVLFLEARAAKACSCGPRQTVLEAYESADLVIIARAVAVEKSEKAGAVNGIRSTRLAIEKVFKGKYKAGDEVVLVQGGGADCVWTFGEDSIDKQYLLYLSSREKNPKVWFAVTCGRSHVLRYATDDLLYLNNMDKVRGRTRISGTIEFEKATDLSVEGRTIRIIGASKTYEVKTDSNGVYEIYDLPPGKYLIEPELPLGWKVDYFWLNYSPSFAGDREERAPKRIPINLEDKRHAGLNIHFEIDNAIRGRVFDPNGKPMHGVCIKAVPAQKDKEGEYLADCTDEDGNYAITEIPRGSYILVINADGKLSSSEPFKTFYYPNVLEREKATVLTIGEGDVLESINISPPALEETVTIEGFFLYSDGKPVVDEAIQFKAEKANETIEANAYIKTDSRGRFSIKILKGVKGRLYGNMYTYIGEFENCPKLESIIKKNGGDAMELETPAIEIRAENNLYNLELKFPFPGCRKAEDK